MNKFNLSDWALEHRSLVWYFMIIFAVAGAYAYLGLGREEDPSFTIKTMVIQAQWPGASAEEVTQQVTDRIEKKLQELDKLEHTRSITTAGQAIVFVDSAAGYGCARRKAHLVAGAQPDRRYQRTSFPRVSSVRSSTTSSAMSTAISLPSPATGLVTGNCAISPKDARTQILKIPDVGKVDIVGAQDEVIYLEFSTRKIAALGIDRADIIATLQAQNAVTQSGFVAGGTGAHRPARRRALHLGRHLAWDQP